MAGIADLIRNSEIEVHSKGRSLSVEIPDYGEYCWNLVHHLCLQADQYVTLRGPGIEQFLRKAQNVMVLTDFLMQMWSTNGEMRFHVLADIEAVTTSYQRKPAEDWIVNGFGKRVANTSTWLPQSTEFEKIWNLCLCSSIGGLVGYPGYEWPLTAEDFEVTVAEHAPTYMIGTYRQLERYKLFASKHPDYCTAILETLSGFSRKVN